MHIKPGIIIPIKILLANVTAVAALGCHTHGMPGTAAISSR